MSSKEPKSKEVLGDALTIKAEVCRFLEFVILTLVTGASASDTGRHWRAEASLKPWSSDPSFELVFILEVSISVTHPVITNKDLNGTMVAFVDNWVCKSYELTLGDDELLHGQYELLAGRSFGVTWTWPMHAWFLPERLEKLFAQPEDPKS